MIELRDYQRGAVEAGLDAFKRGRNGIIVAPTASGKSLILNAIARQLEGNTIIFQPTREILIQNLERAAEFGITDIGVFSASVGQKDIGKVTLATIGSIYNRRELWGTFSNVIIDECHFVNSKAGMYKEFIDAHGGNVLGLTATPYRTRSFNNHKTGQRSVVCQFLTRTKPKIFNELSYVIQIKDLYDEGFLCPLKYTINERYFPKDIKLNSTGLDFDDQALMSYNSKLNILGVIESFIKDKGKRHILVFNKFIQEAETLTARLKMLGITAAIVTGETPSKERKVILESFKTGQIRVVCNVGVLTVGFDFPALDTVILGRPTMSVNLLYQMIGRVMRTYPGKEYAEVVDICGNIRRFGRVEAFQVVSDPDSGLDRLRGEFGWLTGVDFITGQSVEYKPVAGEMVTFGKYNGTKIKDVPSGYLQWGAENLKGVWQKKFHEELSRRKLSP